MRIKTKKNVKKNESLKPRGFQRLLLAAAFGALLVCGVTVFVFDPFYHFHKPWFKLKAVLNEKEYQVPGTLKNFDYDAVLAGSSVVECADNRDIDNAFGCTTVKAVRSYGGTADLCWFLELGHRSREIRQIFYNIDPSALSGEAETTFEATGCPMYLYDDNPFNDVKYLFNRDVLFKRIPYEAARSFSGAYDEGKSYSWAEGKDFSESAVLRLYLRTPSVEEMKPETLWERECTDNIALIEAEVSSHPETLYRFFFSPYSMLWWDNSIRRGERDAVLENERRVMEALVKYPNAEIYNYQGEEDIVCDLGNYMDTIHFTPAINAWVIRRMAAGEGRVMAEDIDGVIEGLKKFSDSLQSRYLREIGEDGRFNYGLEQE